MKTAAAPTPSPLFRTGLLALVAAWPSFARAASPHQVESVSAPAADHHLFVGVDLFAVYDNKIVPIDSFDGARARIEPAGSAAPKFLNRQTGFKWRMNPKVSPIAARLDHLHASAVFAPETDPDRNWASQQIALSNYYGDRVSVAEEGLRTASMDAAATSRAIAAGFGPTDFDHQPATILQRASDAYGQAEKAARHSAADGFVDARDRTRGDGRKVDTLNLAFTLSAPEPIADAYVVALTRIRTPERGFVDLSIQRPVGAIGPTPRDVLITQEGLPPGFEHVATTIHLFNHGKEVATNLSERHLELTEDQAHEYVMLDYLAANKGADRPGEPVWSLAPETLRACADPKLFDCPLRVEVDDDGHLVRIDPLGNRILPAQVRDAVEQMTFVPALVGGRPVAGPITFNPLDYFK